MYDILDVNGNLTPDAAKKVALEISNKVSIRPVQKTTKPDGKENNPPATNKHHDEKPKLEDVPSMTLDECVPIPYEYVGRVIGSQGSTIREIEALSGAKVHIKWVNITGSVEVEKASVFEGTPTQIRIARQKVIDILVKCEKKSTLGGNDKKPRPPGSSGMSPIPKVKKIR